DKTVNLRIDDAGVFLANTPLSYVAATNVNAPIDITGTKVAGYELGQLEATPKMSNLGSLFGRVTRTDGTPYANFSFQLMYAVSGDPGAKIEKKDIITTDGQGYFPQLDLEPGKYYATEVSAYPEARTIGNSLVYVIVGKTFSTAMVTVGETSPMDFTVSDTLTTLLAPVLKSPANLASYSMYDTVGFTWAGVDKATSYILQVKTAPTTIRAGGIDPYQLTKSIAAPMPGQDITATANFNSVPLGIGYYIWQVGAVDSTTGNPVWSPGQTFTIRPLVQDLSPNGKLAPLGASPTVFLTWPKDPNCSHVVIEVFDEATGALLAFDKAGPTAVANNTDHYDIIYDGWVGNDLRWPTGKKWRWHVKYYYSGSNIVITSEDAHIEFVAN
ncbi:MAG TPA: hypothetical protein PLP29_08730, partial [Candidatus Ozemobacteraceae bacterium]|nr:hypothetical protein [Candidatus Ozemobacteraceae bacterium]